MYIIKVCGIRTSTTASATTIIIHPQLSLLLLSPTKILKSAYALPTTYLPTITATKQIVGNMQCG